jgi:hypothetical protein
VDKNVCALHTSFDFDVIHHATTHRCGLPRTIPPFCYTLIVIVAINMYISGLSANCTDLIDRFNHGQSALKFERERGLLANGLSLPFSTLLPSGSSLAELAVFNTISLTAFMNARNYSFCMSVSDCSRCFEVELLHMPSWCFCSCSF